MPYSIVQIDTNSEEQIRSTIRRLNELRNAESQCSFRIKVKGQTITAHRDILVGGSDYFKGMLSNDTKEKQTGEVEMFGVDFESVKICIDFIYGNKVFVSSNKYLDLLNAAKLMQLEHLSDGLEKLMVDLLDIHNFWQLKEVAETYSCKYLEEECRRFAEKNIETLKSREEFYELDKKSFENLVVSSRTKLTEKEKLLLITNWVGHNQELEWMELLKNLKFEQIPFDFIDKLIPQEARNIIRIQKENERTERNQICAFLDNAENLHMLSLTSKKKLQQTPHKRLCSKFRYSVVALNNYIYAISPMRAMHRLNYKADVSNWERMPDMKHERGWWPPAVVVWGEIYVIGGGEGVYSNNIEKYNPDDRKWENMGHTPQKSQGSGIIPLEGKIYMVGGIINEEYVSSVSRLTYDITGWLPLPSMTQQRAFPSATMDFKGHMIVVGGKNETGFLKSAEFCNLATEQWTHLPDINIPRWAFKLYYISGTYICVGGRNDRVASSSFEKYDFEQNSWEMCKITDCDINNTTLIEVKL